ncbi:MAG TPA: response regulator [Vicinamibacterales bacterium]|nr:response regulator [Vicinamibacterales bacterium]
MTVTFPSAAAVRQQLVLLVDADADTRRMYAEYLRLSSAWAVDEAADGREALAKAISRVPAVIVTETRLPGLNGFDLCRLLRSDAVTADISIIVVTGDALEADVARARMAGADAVLVKPCLPDRLCGEIGRVTSREQEKLIASATVDPQLTPPSVVCPTCDTPLRYLRSHVGGVGRHPEQWDYFECTAGCGLFQYRQRTRKLRRV